MDELQLLRATRDDVGPVPPATAERVRERLMRAASEHAEQAECRRRPITRRRPVGVRRALALAAAAAVFLAGSLVAIDVVLPDRPPLNAEAVAVLEEAAAASIRTSDPEVTPGQFLKIETRAMYGSSAVDNGVQMSWYRTTSDQLYIPADPAGEWVWNRDADVPTESAPEAVKEAARLQPTLDPASYAATVGVFRGPGGAFYGGPQPTVLGEPLANTTALPRDPEELLGRIHDHTAGAGKTPDLEAFETIVESLRTGAIPADLRAAFYQAAARVPGVEVMERQATVDGRTGIAIGMEMPGESSRQDMIIDPVSGLVMGERIVILQGFPGVPAGTIESWTSVRTSVVDAAP